MESIIFESKFRKQGIYPWQLPKPHFSNYTHKKNMPPKKKKGKKGKKKGGDGVSPGPEETGEPSEKEIMLQAE